MAQQTVTQGHMDTGTERQRDRETKRFTDTETNTEVWKSRDSETATGSNKNTHRLHSCEGMPAKNVFPATTIL